MERFATGMWVAATMKREKWGRWKKAGGGARAQAMVQTMHDALQQLIAGEGGTKRDGDAG
jgi:hypothetical protein